MSEISEDLITFGKYKNLSVQNLLKDRKYCSWLLEQDWFKNQYSYLYEKIKNYSPNKKFIKEENLYDKKDFIENYPYFNLIKDVELNENEKKCYQFFLKILEKIKNNMIENRENGKNQFDIKMPSSWLKKFEEECKLPRDTLKNFLSENDLDGIPKIIEKIKNLGGISYDGNKGFIIAKERSKKQENFWEEILKKNYGNDIGTQYKFENCIFDFIRIKNNTLYECKLNLKDFDEAQYKKYLTIAKNFLIVYLIDKDCIVDLDKKTIFTTDPEKYNLFFSTTKIKNKLINLIKNFPITKIVDVENYFNL